MPRCRRAFAYFRISRSMQNWTLASLPDHPRNDIRTTVLLCAPRPLFFAYRFCYSGGFTLNAAAGGALRVVAVDSSQPALDEAQINAARNNLEGLTEFVKEDALKFMKVCEPMYAF